jgi:hypothetical protein
MSDSGQRHDSVLWCEPHRRSLHVTRWHRPCAPCPRRCRSLPSRAWSPSARRWAGSLRKRRPISGSARPCSWRAAGAGGAAWGCTKAGRAQSAIERVRSTVSERLAMVVSRKDDGQGTCGRRGARGPQAVAPRRVRRRRARARVVSRSARVPSAFPPCPRPAPQVTSEALPYGILRRMSTDAHGTAPVWAGAVRVGATLGARPCAAVTRRRLVAVVRAIAGLPLLCVRRCIATKDYCTHFAPL